MKQQWEDVTAKCTWDGCNSIIHHAPHANRVAVPANHYRIRKVPVILMDEYHAKSHVPGAIIRERHAFIIEHQTA